MSDQSDDEDDNTSDREELEESENDESIRSPPAISHHHVNQHLVHPLQRFTLPSSPSPSSPLPIGSTPRRSRSIMTDPDTLSLITQLYHLAISSIGPHGSPKLVHLNPNSPYLTLTTSSSRLLGPSSSLPLTHPIDLLLSSSLSSRDGGLYALALTCRLISHSFLFPSLPSSLISHAHSLCLPVLLSSLSSSALSFPFSSLPPLLSLISSILHSKPLPSLTLSSSSHLSLLILRAFILTHPFSSLISYLRLPSSSPSASLLYPGVLLDTIPPPSISPPSSLRCLLYACSLTLQASDWLGEVTVEGTGREEGERQVMERLIELWRGLRVAVVFCQKVMHPQLRQKAASASILVFDRLGVRHVKPLEAVMGVKAVVGLGEVGEESVGSVVMEGKFIGGRRRLGVRGEGKVCCIAVGGESEQVVEELMESVERAMAALVDSAREEGEVRAVPGGGGIESIMASSLTRWLEERGERLRRSAAPNRVMQVERGITEVGDEVVRMMKEMEKVLSGVERQWEEVGREKRWMCLGWEGTERISWRQVGRELMLDEETVMDSVITKQRALRQAFEMAAVVIRVRGVIRA